MAITPEQVKDVEKLRSDVRTLIANDQVNDEYLLATYNGIVRRLDERLPHIRRRAEGKALKDETRELARKKREAVRGRGGQSMPMSSSSTKKSA